MIVNIKLIEEATCLIFDRIRKYGIEELEIEDNLYWNVPNEQLQNMHLAALTPDVGDLAEDYNDLMRIIAGEQTALISHLEELSPLLRKIGLQLSATLGAKGG